MTDDILEELGLPARRPGRPKGSRNKNRVATADRINAEGDPIGFLCKVVRGGKIKAAAIDGATSRTWCYPTIDQRKDAAVTLAKKVMPDLRPSDVEIAVNGEKIVVISGIARSPTSPPLSDAEAERWQRIVDNGAPPVVDVTPAATPMVADSGSPSVGDSMTTSPAPDVALPAARPWHPHVPAPAESPPQAVLPPHRDPKHDDNLCRATDDAKIREMNSRASRFIA
jgi:hypothetical protein